MSVISSLFRQSVTIFPFVRQGAGVPVFGQPEIRKCRIQTGRQIKNGRASGVLEQQPSGALMFCTGEVIPNRSIVQYKDRQYIVVQCKEMIGFGINHLEVVLE